MSWFTTPRVRIRQVCCHGHLICGSQRSVDLLHLARTPRIDFVARTYVGESPEVFFKKC